jgi:hypothetical protein
MRITDDELRTKAIRKKRSIKKSMARSVETEVCLTNKKKKRRVVLPLVRSTRPASLQIDKEKIHELIRFP